MMRYRKAAWVVGVLMFTSLAGHGQVADGTEGIELHAKAIQQSPDGGVFVQLSVVNHSKALLQIPIVVDWTPFKINVRDENGVEPQETMLGCKLHLSKACGPEFHFPTTGRSDSLYVPAGEESTFRVAISSEYVLRPGTAYTVSIELSRSILINAPVDAKPQEIAKSPSRNLGMLRSNTVIIQLPQ